ncbi:MAG: hypothetical protein GXP22_00035 [Gammaproteobacteria bacterium]|nr:hypothetical protein [Gammaproteobacteria bacterium]
MALSHSNLSWDRNPLREGAVINRQAIQQDLRDFKIENHMLRYSSFIPRFYNFCKTLGLTPGKIIPSRAFCSDESQGYPIILIAKHFGAFPFNHGHVGGIVATDRHGPHATHGKDAVIIQASHVGYDPQTRTFGDYRRLQTANNDISTNCGKIESVLNWYLEEYEFARNNIFLHKKEGQYHVIIDNQLIEKQKAAGLELYQDKIIQYDEYGYPRCTQSWSTAKGYLATPEFVHKMNIDSWQEQHKTPIMDQLSPELFSFKKEMQYDKEGRDHLEINLLSQMPVIICSANPMLAAACINTRIEFERSFRSIIKEHAYKNKNVVLISGLNIDISPQQGQLFPLTKFVPWAASVHREDGSYTLMEQEELWQTLLEQEENNNDEIDLEKAIQLMKDVEEIHIHFD